MSATHLDQQVRSRLATHDVRYTDGRRRVVAALAAADGPRSAAELHDDLRRTVPLSSLYRSLAVMAETGVLDEHHGTKSLTRYELAEWLVGHHHHLVCVSCGSVDDIQLPADAERTLESVISRAVQVGGFAVEGHSLEIDGRCASCSS